MCTSVLEEGRGVGVVVEPSKFLAGIPCEEKVAATSMSRAATTESQ